MTDPNRTHAPEQDDDAAVEGAHLTTFDPGTDSASEELVWSVCEVTGDDPEELPVLSEVIDPDALDRLFRSPDGVDRDSDLAMEFTYGEARVRIAADGTVLVEATDDSADE